jgi:hypothetical protein
MLHASTAPLQIGSAIRSGPESNSGGRSTPEIESDAVYTGMSDDPSVEQCRSILAESWPNDGEL